MIPQETEKAEGDCGEGFFFPNHEWTKWSTPFEVRYTYGSGTQGIETHQRRECLKCGKIEEAEV